MYEGIGIFCECSREVDVVRFYLGLAKIIKSFFEFVFIIIRKKGEGLRVKVFLVFKLNVNFFVWLIID